MAEDDRDDTREGWHVPFRIGAISGIATPIVLAIAVLIAGVIYSHTLRPKLHYSVTPQPAPGLEAGVHAGVTDPQVPPPIVRRDPAIERAKAETAAEGLPGWPAGKSTP